MRNFTFFSFSVDLEMSQDDINVPLLWWITNYTPG